MKRMMKTMTQIMKNTTGLTVCSASVSFPPWTKGAHTQPYVNPDNKLCEQYKKKTLVLFLTKLCSWNFVVAVGCWLWTFRWTLCNRFYHPAWQNFLLFVILEHMSRYGGQLLVPYLKKDLCSRAPRIQTFCNIGQFTLPDPVYLGLFYNYLCHWIVHLLISWIFPAKSS